MTEHTPGTWTALPPVPDGTCFRADVVTSSRKSGLDVMPAQAAGYTAAEAAANARLIAAAPGMLKALKRIELETRDAHPNRVLLSEVHSVAHVVIGAAEAKKG